MGNAIFSRTLSRGLAERCIDTLQEKGLKHFAPKVWGLQKWSSIHVFGTEYTRNQLFKTMIDQLAPLIKRSFQQAQFKQINSSFAMEDFLTMNFTHHIMKCLLTPEIEHLVQYNEIIKETFGYKLPPYDKAKISEFQQGWTNVSSEVSISLDTLVDIEQELLSATLGHKIHQIIETIDLVNLFANAITTFNQMQNAKVAAKMGLFAQAGAANLLAERADYSDEEQKSDALAGIVGGSKSTK